MEKFKIIDLDCGDSYGAEYPLLKEDLKDIAREMIQKNKLLKGFDTRELLNGLCYSLSYSHGDGVSFNE